MPNVIELIKKGKIFSYLAKFHLTNEELEEIYLLYTLINEKINNHFDENTLLEYKENRIKILNNILDDLAEVVHANKAYMVNKFTLEYLLSKHNSLTLLQFANSFRFMMNQSNINRVNNYYIVDNFMNYFIDRMNNDMEYQSKIKNDSLLLMIYNEYMEGYNILLELNNKEIIKVYTKLVGIIWSNNLFNKYDNLVVDVAIYLYNNYIEVLENLSDDGMMDEESLCDSYDLILDKVSSNKVMKIN